MDFDATANGLSNVAPAGDAPLDAYRLLACHEAVEPIARDGISIGELVDASEVEWMHLLSATYTNTNVPTSAMSTKTAGNDFGILRRRDHRYRAEIRRIRTRCVAATDN